MNKQQIKTKLIATFGEKSMAYLHALRFIYLLWAKQTLEPEIRLLPLLVHKGETVIDVGANGADWTYWLHHFVGNTGSVFAFEADPYYAKATDVALKLMCLKGVHLFPYGLSEENEKVPLAIFDVNGSRLSGRSHIDKYSEKTEETQIVELKRLDSLVEYYPQLAAAKLIKCDVEGYELIVFRGAVEIMDSSRPIVILEIGHFETQGYSVNDVYDFFSIRNYVSFAMVSDKTIAQTNQMMEHKEALSVNRVLIPVEQITMLSDKIQIILE